MDSLVSPQLRRLRVHSHVHQKAHVYASELLRGPITGRIQSKNACAEGFQSGPKSWTQGVDPSRGPKSWTQGVDPRRGPKAWTQVVDPSRGPKSWTQVVDPLLESNNQEDSDSITGATGDSYMIRLVAVIPMHCDTIQDVDLCHASAHDVDVCLTRHAEGDAPVMIRDGIAQFKDFGRDCVK
ncbi:hypothetical protein EYF80_009158 [Liparis tanakae]|uniref:Uncharacterized protein n=1 Tax=Liparis tanakae TaxID=230148 RepID=A0A4Z2IRL0_9TELE|nr:hypothetical protein EYF80_009158 [Liparis tanakae]